MSTYWFGRPAVRISKKRSSALGQGRRLRLFLETLEDRTVPSLSPIGPYEVSANSHSPALAYNSRQVAGLDIARPLVASTTTLSSSPNPAVFGQDVTFVASVTGSGGTPTGTVVFLDGGTTIGTGVLNGLARASFATSVLAVGLHSIEAVYSGDANFAASESSVLTVTVGKDSTSTAIASSIHPSNFGQAVTFTATVTANAPGAGTPSGSVEFLDNGTSIGMGALSGGSASFATALLAPGTQSITALYGGSANFSSSSSSTLTQTVIFSGQTLTVTSNADPNGPAGTLSLRQAIEMANTYTAGPSTIDFAIANGTETVVLASALPTITQPVIIDATPPSNLPSQKIVLKGSSTLDASGLTISSSGSIVNGVSHLAIEGLGGAGILLEGNEDQVLGTFLGTDWNGTTGVGNGVGLTIAGSSNTVGGVAAATRDIISGNTGDGVSLFGLNLHGLPVVDDNVIEGDYIGTNSAGTAALPNGQDGIFLEEGSGNTIGGTTAGAADLISGNTGVGIEIGAAVFSAPGNIVEGDFIGPDIGGIGPLPNSALVPGVPPPGAFPNGAGGILLESSNNTIGGTVAGAGNLISGNNGWGISTAIPFFVTGEVVEGNYIGTHGGGIGALPNASGGVSMELTSNCTIGGTAAGAANVISGNGGIGLAIGGVVGTTASNLVEGNYIGTNSAGAALGNADFGILIEGSNNTVGGTSLAASNVISDNGQAGNSSESDGISITLGTGNLIEGNYVGTDSTGNLALGNAGNGISVFSSSNTVGGLIAGARNIISANAGAGIAIEGQTIGVNAVSNIVEGDYIGSNSAGTAALGNGGAGVLLEGPTTGNQIGTRGGGNIISGNKGDGVDILESGNTVAYNVIGANITGTAGLGNGGSGVEIGGNSNVIGGTYNSTSGAVSSGRNVIAFNGAMGVVVNSGTGNTILIDSIFSNVGLGIDLLKGANNGIAAPSLTGVTTSGNTSTISGTFSSAANTVYLIEVFLNTNSPAGQVSLGYVQVHTNSSGMASFSLQTADTLSAGETLSATATDPAGDTSELSGTIPA